MPAADLSFHNRNLATAARDSSGRLPAFLGDLLDGPPIAIELGLLATQCLPALDDHVHVLRIQLSEAQTPRLLTVEQAAQYIGRSVRGLRGMIARGTIPVIKGDGRVMLGRQDLDTWIDQNRVQAD
jgi:excisionase family DNA binding protein